MNSLRPLGFALVSFLAVGALPLVGCSKKDEGPSPAPSTTTLPLSPLGTTSIVGSPGTASASAGTASATATPSAATAAGAPAADYTGTYKATPGTLYVPEEKDWKGFRFRGEDAGTGLGDGTITIKVKEGGRVEGDGDGPFGKFVLSGVVAEAGISAAVLRKDPTDGGFTGFLIGTKKGDGFEGTMKLSLAQGNVLRDATFTVKK